LKEAVVRVLDVLWHMAHDDSLTRFMLDHVLQCQIRIFSESRSLPSTIKRDYCLKCVTDLQLQQNWLVPAIRHLHDLLRHDSTNTGKRTDDELISLLVYKHDLIHVLIKSLSICQRNVWRKTRGHVTKDTLVDGRFTHEESVKTHLDLLSFLLKKKNVMLILSRSEELWDTLISSEHISSFDRELGLDWFIRCVDDIAQESRRALFKKRVSTMDPIHMTFKGE
jgi:hypothetical protein